MLVRPVGMSGEYGQHSRHQAVLDLCFEHHNWLGTRSLADR